MNLLPPHHRLYGSVARLFRFVMLWGAIDQQLKPSLFVREELPFESSVLAAQAHQVYRQKGGSKNSPLPDFFIGAHAEVAGFTLLTRDAARYRTYFPRVALLCPP